MEVRNRIKVEKDDYPFNINNKQQKIEVMHQEQLIRECSPENINQRFDGLQTREEFIIKKNKEKLESKNDLENIKPKSKWDKSKTRFSEKWKFDRRLRAWIKQDFKNPHKVLCQFCNILIRAHKADLYKHAVTSKHRKNVDRTRRAASEAKESYADVDENRENNDESAREIVLSVSEEYNPNLILKKEKIDEPFEPFILVEAHENGASFSAEDQNENGNVFMAYSEEDESFSPSKSFSDQEISEIARRIGIALMKEVTKLLQDDKNILKFFKDNDEDLTTISNINKLTKICIGHLSQKYLVESTVGSANVKPSVDSGKKNGFSCKLTSIEERLETAVSEMRFLKRNFDETSLQSVPVASFDMSKIFGRSCDQ